MGILKNKGQSTVEYILLLAVVASLITTVFRSDVLNNFIGKDGQFFRNYADYIGYTYRHGSVGSAANDDSDVVHRSYDNRLRIPRGLYDRE